MGYVFVEGFVLSSSIVKDGDDMKAVAVLSNNLLVGFNFPKKAASNKRESID